MDGLRCRADYLLTLQTTGKALARVIPAMADDYDRVVMAAHNAFSTWRETPAPQRGLLVRDLGVAVRESLEPWAS